MQASLLCSPGLRISQPQVASRGRQGVCRASKKGGTVKGGRASRGANFISVPSLESDGWRLKEAADIISSGGVGIIPTDTIYAIVCDVENRQAVEKLYQVKQVEDPLKKPLSLICRNFEDIAAYTLGFPAGGGGAANLFRVAKQNLPGPFTLILPASKKLPKSCILDKRGDQVCSTRRTVGVRMPNDPICQALLALLDRPLLCTSVRVPADSGSKWLAEPAQILDEYSSLGVDFVIDGGDRISMPSTVIDLSSGEPKLLRQGAGDSSVWGLEADTEDLPQDPALAALGSEYGDIVFA